MKKILGVALKKKKPLDGLIRARGNYVLNQKSFKFLDRRTRRNRDKASHKRNAINESSD